MSIAPAPDPPAGPAAPTSPFPFKTVAELLDHLGGIPAGRVRFVPAPGTATEQDVLDADAHEDRLCELIDGVLVEKTVGWEEGEIGALLMINLGGYILRHRLGRSNGEGGMIKLLKIQVRIPDFAFYSWDHLPPDGTPLPPIPELVPTLAVEVLSKSNTRREMGRKLREYFTTGTRLVWYIDPKQKTVRVYTGIEAFSTLAGDDVLDGGEVVPGFSISLNELFAAPQRPEGV